MRRSSAFTLIEALVVMGIVAALTAILYPVLRQAIGAAHQSVCLSNFRQVSQATLLYQSDYDDLYMVARYRPGGPVDARTDRTWAQLLLPYLRDFRVFRCPADNTHPSGNGVFDDDLLPGDTYARFYQASMRSNIGFNFVYLSPLIQVGPIYEARPRGGSEVADPARTLLFGESAWEINPQGRPQGGGSYLVVPPCRYSQSGAVRVDSFGFNGIPDENIYTGSLRWTVRGDRTREMGGLFPRHRNRLNVVFTGGNAASVTLAEATVGCNVSADWSGDIVVPERYLWDLR